MKKYMKGLSTQRNEHFVRNIVVAIGVVLVWRWVWHLADEYLFPNHYTLSSVVSLIIWVIILYFPEWDLKALGGVQEEVKPILDNKTRDLWIIGMTVAIIIAILVALYLLVK